MTSHSLAKMLLTCYPNPKLEDKELFIQMLVKIFDGYSPEMGSKAVEKLVTEKSPRFIPSIGLVKATCQCLQNRIDYKRHLEIKNKEQGQVPDYSEQHKKRMKGKILKLLGGEK